MVGQVICSYCTACDFLIFPSTFRLRALDPPILLGRVGVPDQLEVAKRFGVGGYPLLIVFRHGKQYNYTGVRDEDGELVMVVTNTCLYH